MRDSTYVRKKRPFQLKVTAKSKDIGCRTRLAPLDLTEQMAAGAMHRTWVSVIPGQKEPQLPKSSVGVLPHKVGLEQRAAVSRRGRAEARTLSLSWPSPALAL